MQDHKRKLKSIVLNRLDSTHRRRSIFRVAKQGETVVCTQGIENTIVEIFELADDIPHRQTNVRKKCQDFVILQTLVDARHSERQADQHQPRYKKQVVTGPGG